MWWLNLLVVVAESPIVVAESLFVVAESLSIVVAESPNVVAQSSFVVAYFLPRQQQPVLGDCTTTLEILVPVRSV